MKMLTIHNHQTSDPLCWESKARSRTHTRTARLPPARLWLRPLPRREWTDETIVDSERK